MPLELFPEGGEVKEVGEEVDCLVVFFVCMNDVVEGLCNSEDVLELAVHDEECCACDVTDEDAARYELEEVCKFKEGADDGDEAY